MNQPPLQRGPKGGANAPLQTRQREPTTQGEPLVTAARPSDWAVSPHRAAAEADAAIAAREQARHDLDVLYDALAVLQRRNKAYRAAGLKAETAVTMRQIENTEAQINERRAVLEGKATR